MPSLSREIIAKLTEMVNKNEMYGRIQLKIESISNFQITWNNQFDTWFVIRPTALVAGAAAAAKNEHNI